METRSQPNLAPLRVSVLEKSTRLYPVPLFDCVYLWRGASAQLSAPIVQLGSAAPSALPVAIALRKLLHKIENSRIQLSMPKKPNAQIVQLIDCALHALGMRRSRNGRSVIDDINRTYSPPDMSIVFLSSLLARI